MLSNREQASLQKYIDEIHLRYNQKSVVPYLTTVREETNSSAPNFIKIGRRFKIPREYLEEDHIIIVYPFARFVELSEYQYIIDILRKTSTVKACSDAKPTIELIDRAIARIWNTTIPNYIIIPIAFYVDLHMVSRSSNIPIIHYEGRNAFYRYRNRRLRVFWSNKYISLNEIIIGSSGDSQWLFKPADGGSRMTVKFFTEDAENLMLLVKTVFRFIPPQPERLSTVEFPEKLCRLESSDNKEK